MDNCTYSEIPGDLRLQMQRARIWELERNNRMLQTEVYMWDKRIQELKAEVERLKVIIADMETRR